MAGRRTLGPRRPPTRRAPPRWLGLVLAAAGSIGSAGASDAPPAPSAPPLLTAAATEETATPTLAAATPANDTRWPVTIVVQGWLLHLEQPAWTQWQGNRLEGRIVLRLTPLGALGQQDVEAPQAQVVGVAWIDVTAVPEEDHLAVAQVDLTHLVIPGATVTQSDTIAEGLRDGLPEVLEGIPLARVRAAVAAAQAHAALATAPAPVPTIRIATTPTALVVLAGPPVLRPFGTDGRLERVINTPSALLRDRDGGAWWLLDGGRWYTAATLQGSWRAVDAVPAEIARWTHDPALAAGARSSPAPQPPVAFLVATSPTELVVLDGPPRLEPIAGTDLALIANADHPLFRYGPDGALYLLASGRWLRVTGATDDPAQILATLSHGRWQAQPATRLPTDFARLPADRFAAVRASVPGTTEAEESVVAAQVPVLARIPRQATVAVHWDGAPRFSAIPGTALAYATTSDAPVLRVGADGPYYTLQQGVWYVASDPHGPWTVATATPPDLARIPPSSPVFNCSAVQVYEVEPDWVYDGYDAAYLGVEIDDGCVVWGTGYAYPCSSFGACLGPWTWGFNMCYHPAWGWWAPWAFGRHPWGHAAWGWRGPVPGRFLRPTIAARAIDARAGWLGPLGEAPLHRTLRGPAAEDARGTPSALYAQDRARGVEPVGTRLTPAQAPRPGLEDRGTTVAGWGQPPVGVLPHEAPAVEREAGGREPFAAPAWRTAPAGAWGGSSAGTLGSERLRPEPAPFEERAWQGMTTTQPREERWQAAAPAWRTSPRAGGFATSGGGARAGTVFGGGHGGGRGGGTRR